VIDASHVNNGDRFDVFVLSTVWGNVRNAGCDVPRPNAVYAPSTAIDTSDARAQYGIRIEPVAIAPYDTPGAACEGPERNTSAGFVNDPARIVTESDTSIPGSDPDHV
jgi:hypothetical protein